MITPRLLLRFLPVVLAACTLAAQGDDALLERARHAMRARLANTPNYTCVLEIDRSRYAKERPGRYAAKELARLEISVVGGREQFAWPGEASTKESIEDLLGPGLSSTGEFSAHGRSTLLDERSTVERLPAALQTETGLAGFEYSVPLEASRYAVAGGKSRSFAPYEGELWVDEDSGELVRFEVRVPKPPAKSGVQRIDSNVRYELREVSGQSAWLPSRARIAVKASTGEEFRNDLRFLDCRAFRAESSIRFDDEALDSTDSSGVAHSVVVPQGLDLEIEIQTAFNSDHVRAGDPFEASLLRAPREGGVIPKGASVSGRVRRLALMDGGRGRGARRVAMMTLELSELRWKGYCGRLSATLRAVEKIPKMAPVHPNGLQMPPAFFKSERALGFRSTPRMSKPGSGTFVVLGDLYEIPSGARMRWLTETAPAATCAAR